MTAFIPRVYCQSENENTQGHKKTVNCVSVFLWPCVTMPGICTTDYFTSPYISSR